MKRMIIPAQAQVVFTLIKIVFSVLWLNQTAVAGVNSSGGADICLGDDPSRPFPIYSYECTVKTDLATGPWSKTYRFDNSSGNKTVRALGFELAVCPLKVNGQNIIYSYTRVVGERYSSASSTSEIEVPLRQKQFKYAATLFEGWGPEQGKVFNQYYWVDCTKQ